MDNRDERISSFDLAALVIDALLRAKVINENDVTHAIAIAAEEIEVRKAMGDY